MSIYMGLKDKVLYKKKKQKKKKKKKKQWLVLPGRVDIDRSLTQGLYRHPPDVDKSRPISESTSGVIGT